MCFLFTHLPTQCLTCCDSFVLDITDLQDIDEALRTYHFLTINWHQLGLHLGLTYDKLTTIEANYRQVERCLQEYLSCWLRMDYDTSKYNKPTWTALAIALEKIGEKVTANGIRQNKCQ